MSRKNKLVLLLLYALCATSGRAETVEGALVLPVQLTAKMDASKVLEPAATVWSSVKAKSLHLNQTPALYEGDVPDDVNRPEVSIRLVRLENGSVVLRAQWIDTSPNIAEGGKGVSDTGEAHVDKKHSAQTDTFPDAFCAMVPVKRGPHSVYPSMMMGDKQQPVELYFWKAGVGFEFLGAHGRGSTKASTTPMKGRVLREGDQWTVTMALPNMEPSTPVCFAVWDGAMAHRDGLKYFSLWYEVQ